MSVTNRLIEGLGKEPSLNLKSQIPKGIWTCGSEVKFVHMKYEKSSNLVLIEHQMDVSRQCLFVHQNHGVSSPLPPDPVAYVCYPATHACVIMRASMRVS